MKIALLLTLALAVGYDLKERRIPNHLILAGLAVALAVAMAGGAVAGLGHWLAGVALGIAVFFPFFALGMIGAGDVKLFGVVGGFVGWQPLLAVLLYTLLAGGLLGLYSLTVGRSFPQFFSNLKLAFFSMIYQGSGISLKDVASQSAARIPYAVAIATGTVIWMVRQP